MNQNLQKLIDETTLQLEKVSAQAKQEAWWILQAITKKTMLQLLVDQNFILSDDEQVALDEAIYNRTENNMPLQYVLGFVPFCGLSLFVEPPTLIPRPETEEWTSWLVGTLKPLQRQKLSILDLCTGSGCVAVALAKHFPVSQVVAVDISEDAMLLAEKNKEAHKLINLAFFESDLYTGLSVDQNKFDIIVSNPPYLSVQEWKELDETVTEWEDARALVAGQTGLELYQKIISQAQQHLKPLSKEFIAYQIPRIVLEFGINQAEVIADLLHQYGFKEIRVYKDIAGKNRWISAQ